MKKKGILLSSFETQDLLALMQIYLSEWMHRDELLWKQVFKYFYATLFVLFLPNIAAFVQIELPDISPHDLSGGGTPSLIGLLIRIDWIRYEIGRNR